MHKIKYWIRDYFGSSPKEIKGFILLMCLILFLLILPPLVKPLIFTKDSHQADKQKLDSLIAKFENKPKADETISARRKPEGLFKFDPNTLDEEGFLKLGVDSKTAQRITNYKSKGGKFFIKSDFKKIYGLQEEKYLSLYPYIDLPVDRDFTNNKPSSTRISKSRSHFNSPKKLSNFDINLADTSQLIQLKGIGSKLAQRITKYREKIGGFVREEQYKEVYGLDSIVVETLTQYTFISPDFNTKKININTATFQELKEHPYIQGKYAKLIIAYREQHGPFTSVDNLKKIKTIDDNFLSKVSPYLTL